LVIVIVSVARDPTGTSPKSTDAREVVKGAREINPILQPPLSSTTPQSGSPSPSNPLTNCP